MTDVSSRIAALPPEKRRLLELRLKKEGLRAPRKRDPEAEIPRRLVGKSAPLSFGQQRLWFIHRLAPESSSYNIPFAGRLRGTLDTRHLGRALGEITRRHEILRTRFIQEDSEPVQVVDARVTLHLPRIDLSALPGARAEAEAARLTASHPHLPFDLTSGPTWRVHLVHLNAHHHALLVTMHHILTDAWSMAVFFRELPVLYDAFRQGKPSPLPPLAVQVADHAAWQRQRMRGARLEAELAFWKEHLEGAKTVLDLPFDRPRPPAQTLVGRRHPVAVPQPVVDGLRALGERRGTTMFMALLAAFDVLLYRYTGQNDVLVGSPFAIREPESTHPLIGFFINIAVLRGRLDGTPSFTELLDRVRDTTLASLAHQELPFEHLLDMLQLTRDASRPPLVQVYFVLQNVHIPRPDFQDLEVPQVQQTDSHAARVDLTVGLWEETGLNGWFEYNVDLFDPSTIDRMGRHYLRILAAAVDDPECAVERLELLGGAERHQVLYELSSSPPQQELWEGVHTDVHTGVHTGVHIDVLNQAQIRPDAIAVAEPWGTQLTYFTLVTRAGRLAHILRSRGVTLETPVAVFLEPGLELAVALLAVLQAGATYVPIDPHHSAERLATPLHDANVRLLITRSALEEKLPSLELPRLLLEELDLEQGAETTVEVDGGQLAYVIYTSGSTGRPKGVGVSHRNALGLLDATHRCTGSTPGESWTLFHSPAFDFSVWELWGALTSGGRVLPVASYQARDPQEFRRLLIDERVTVLSQTPSAFRPLIALGAPPPTLERVLFGGESLLHGDVEPWLSGPRMINFYGITETTVFVSWRAMVPADRHTPWRSDIGAPLAGFAVHLVDRQLQPVPLGVPGELLVGGVGLARGYLGRPRITAEKFVPDPFGPGSLAGTALRVLRGRSASCLSGGRERGEGGGGVSASSEHRPQEHPEGRTGQTPPGDRLYRSGDLGRWLPGGGIEYLGRGDQQLKIRGFRIEPGEIEAAIAAHPQVGEAVVVAMARGGHMQHRDTRDRRLVAWLVPRGETPDRGELRSFLHRRLPDYMVPTLAFLDALPRASTGKADRAALERRPLPQESTPTHATSAPEKPSEQKLAEIWCELLGVEQIGLEDDFFALGGDSILAIQVASRAAQRGLKLELRDLFAHPTLEAMASVATPIKHEAAGHQPLMGPVPLAPVQRWFFDLDLPAPEHWNMAVLLAGELPPPGHLSAAVDALVRRHDLLRARFWHDGEEWQQEVTESRRGGAPTSRVDLAGLSKSLQDTALRGVLEEAQRGLPLDSGPLLRAVAVHLGEAVPGRLLLVAHHLVVDGVSWRILLEDLQGALAALTNGVAMELPLRTASYRDWCEGFEGLELDHPTVQPPPLPRDFPTSGRGLEREAATVEVMLDPETTRALLQDTPTAYQTRIDDLLLTALVEALAPWIGERHLGLDLEGHGREPLGDPLDISRTVGWFTRLTAVDLDLRLLTEPGESIKAIKERLRAIPPGSFDARYELSFNNLGQLDQTLGQGRFHIAPEAPRHLRCPDGERTHVLQVDALILDGTLRLHWTYSQSLHRRETIERLTTAWRDAIERLIDHCRAPEAGGRTPSDFPQANLAQGDLDKLLGRLGGKKKRRGNKR